MRLSEEGVARLLKKGKEQIKKELFEHTKELWIQRGLIKPVKKSSFWGNLCCIGFMILFFCFMVFSKLNEETLSIFGMSSAAQFVVSLWN